MTEKHWKLKVTHLDDNEPLANAVITAANWMTALAEGRKAIGEKGGVPPGATCNVERNGQVTVRDPASKKVYRLLPSNHSLSNSSRSPENAHTSQKLTSPNAEDTNNMRKRRATRLGHAASDQTQRSSSSTDAVEWLTLLHARDEEPSRDNPLRYRERIFVQTTPDAAPSALKQALNTILNAQIADLEEAERGKFIRLAAFDHAWSERPERPPTAILEWKDWTDTVVYRQPSLPVEVPTSEPEGPRATPADTQAQPEATASEPARPAVTDEKASPPETASSQAIGDKASQTPEKAFIANAAAETSTTETSTTETSTTETSTTETSTAETSTAETSTAETSTAETSTAETSTKDVHDAPSGVAAVATNPAEATGQKATSNTPSLSNDETDDMGLSFSDDVLDSAASRFVSESPEDRLTFAFEATQDLFFLETGKEGADFCLELLTQLIPCEAASVSLYDINTDELRFITTTGPSRDSHQGIGLSRTIGLLGVAAQAMDEVRLIRDASNHPKFDPKSDQPQGMSTRTMAHAGVSSGGQFLGVIQLINRETEAHFTRDDAGLLAYVADKFAEFLLQVRFRVESSEED